MKDPDSTAWYLNIGKGHLTLRLDKKLSIGESTQGELKIDAKEAVNRWLNLSPEGDQLLVEVRRKDIVLIGEDGPLTVVDDCIKVESGTLLSFPENELYLGTSMLRGVPLARVVAIISDSEELTEEPSICPLVERSHSAVTLSTVIDAPENDMLPHEPVASDVAEGETMPTWPFAMPTEYESYADEPSLVEPTTEVDEQTVDADQLQIPEPQRDSQPTAAQSQEGSKPFAPLTVAILTIVVLTAGGFWYFTTTPTPKADKPSTIKTQKETVAAIESPPLKQNEPESARTAKIQLVVSEETGTRPSIESTPVAAPVSVFEPTNPSEPPTTTEQPGTTRTPIRSAEPDPIVEKYLASARLYLEEGYVIEPAPDGRTAIDEISQALFRDPVNQEALNLMTAAAESVLLDAKATYDAGFEYEARNILEELLAFHPEHPEGNQIWQQWTGRISSTTD